MTCNIGKEGGGVLYGHLQTWGFNYNAMVQKQPEGSVGSLVKDKIKSEFTVESEDNGAYSDRTIRLAINPLRSWGAHRMV